MPGLYKLRYVAATAASELYSTRTPHSVQWQWQAGNSNGTCSAYSEVWNWCKEQYGTIGYRWVPRIGAGTILFTDEKDAMLFLLRWA